MTFHMSKYIIDCIELLQNICFISGTSALPEENKLSGPNMSAVQIVSLVPAMHLTYHLRVL